MSRISSVRLALSVLAALLFLQTAAQAFLQCIGPSGLPAAEFWRAQTVSSLPLLGLQLLVLLAMAGAIVRLDRITRRPWLGKTLFAIGLIYLAATAALFLVGASSLASSSWTDAPLAITFHIVLAGWTLILAYWLLDLGTEARVRRLFRKAVQRAAYPVVLATAICLYGWLHRTGAPLAFAAYLPVALGASAILILEIAAPYRQSWRPDTQAVLHDALYLALVQMLLPAGLSLAVASFAADRFGGAGLANIWPHDLPVLAQAALMLAAADLLRYWLHRAAHHWPPVWRLHAVHHAPEALYFLNVGRFHPLDKALQFLLDAAPFILLGVGPDVISAYFVFYALNGFFQHSNVDVRLGPLNWVIAGPELHRWHHSRIIEESNSNFGNNLIVWDALFGTRFLPRRKVGDLGLLNRSYPKDIVGQTLAPAYIPTDEVGASGGDQ